MLRRLSGVTQAGFQTTLIGIREVVEVRKEYHVEFTPFAHLGDVLIQFGLGPVIAPPHRFGVPPHCQAVLCRAMREKLCMADKFFFHCRFI